MKKQVFMVLGSIFTILIIVPSCIGAHHFNFSIAEMVPMVSLEIAAFFVLAGLFWNDCADTTTWLIQNWEGAKENVGLAFAIRGDAGSDEDDPNADPNCIACCPDNFRGDFIGVDPRECLCPRHRKLKEEQTAASN